jgi:hypothetical protein
MVRKLVDDGGVIYEVAEDLLNAPHNGGPSKRLYDQSTGQAYDLPADLFADDGGSGSNGGGGPKLPAPTLQYQEKLIEVLLERTSLNPPNKERVAMLIGPLLAIGKITSKEEFRIVMLEIENLIRSLYISNTISEEDSVYLMDQIEFFARWQLRRSITYDGKPNEREWWTIQSIHQKSEIKGEAPGAGGGVINTIARAFGKGRY